MPETKVSYDYVNKPSHYEIYKGLDALDLIENQLTKEEFIGYLKGNILKYTIRKGNKPNEPLERDQAKIEFYKTKLNQLL